VDEIDRHLLTILQGDATLSIAQMADIVGLSPTPCWKRIQKLENAGVISRRVAIVDPNKVGMGLSVFVAIESGDHTPEWLQRFADAVAEMPEVMELYRMAGDIDYMLRVAVADMAEYDAFYKRLIKVAPLKNVTSRFAMERLKHSTAYPLHSKMFRDRRAVDEPGDE
jgi:Lrp/AsnC family transcriptional regulator